MRISERTLKRLIAESIGKAIRESKVPDFSSDKPQFDINGDEWNGEFARMEKDSYPRYYGPNDPDRVSDAAAEEFINTPNAARDFKNFPRQSRSNGGVKDYDSLRNGTGKIQALKRKRADYAEKSNYMMRMLDLCKRANLYKDYGDTKYGVLSKEDKRALEELPQNMGWYSIYDQYDRKYGREDWYWEDDDDVPYVPLWSYVAKRCYGTLLYELKQLRHENKGMRK